MQPLSEIAYAKINLALHVRARRSDGYHDIETLFAFVDDGDRLEAMPSGEISLSIHGPFGAGLEADDSNLVLRAANMLKRHYGVAEGAAIRLDKRLPVASGIGGGSADAAATARLLNKLWHLGASEAELAALLAPLGADIPACVYRRTCFGSGTGVDLELLADNGLSGKPVLLVNPRKGVSTAAIFSAWDGHDLGPIADGGIWRAALSGRNDLAAMAMALCPEIGEILRALEATGALLVRMSGSGATCFAIFDNEAELSAAIQVMQPHWWTMSGKIL